MLEFDIVNKTTTTVADESDTMILKPTIFRA